MKKSYLSLLLSILIVGVTLAAYLILKDMVMIPKVLVIIIFTGIILLCSYFIYFSNKNTETKDNSVHVKSVESFL